jgi:uncharacterized integral membrane protein
MRVVTWILRAFVFFALFAFALNNQQTVTVHWFFGAQWQAPMVIVVLIAFAAGSALGVLAMVPAWWRGRRRGGLAGAPSTASTPTAAAGAPAMPVSTLAHPPRDGL